MSSQFFNSLYSTSVIGAAILSVFTAVQTAADPAPPLAMGNRTPFTHTLISPTAPDITQLVGQHQINGKLDLSSHSLIQATDTAQTELDGESLRMAIGWQYRPTQRLIVRAELPFVSHRGGFLDSIIDDWHNLTGLPDGERDRQPQDRLLFGVENANGRYVLDSRTQRLGDATISASYQLFGHSDPLIDNTWRQNLWTQLSVKLPTGRIDSLTGSEATDFALSVHFNRWQTTTRPWSVTLDGFVMRIGDGKLFLKPEKTQWQVQARVAKSLTESVIPEVQLRYRSRSYNSDLPALGSDSLGIDAGITAQRPNGYWKLGFSEDLDVDSAPDVGFYLQYFRVLNP